MQESSPPLKLVWAEEFNYSGLPKPACYPDYWRFDKPFYLLLNTAIGGNWGGARGIDDRIFPLKHSIDYVRYYQWE